MAPGLEIVKYSFCNTDGARFTGQFTEELTWRNTGNIAITAYEIVTIKYDAFNRRVLGSRATFGGVSSANWTPLQPGASGTDGLLEPGISHVFTGVAYVSAVRYSDGRVWTVEQARLAEEVRRRVAADFRDLGDLNPDKPAVGQR